MMRRQYGAMTLALLLLVSVLSADAAHAQDARSNIEQANRLMQDEQYERAIPIYESVLKQGFENGWLHYNLGNAYFKQDDRGRAILHYLKARKLLPRREQVEANLMFAVQKTEDRLDWRVPEPVTTVLFWVEDVTLREHVWVLVAANLVVWPAAALYVARRAPGTRLARNIALGVLALLLLSTMARGWYDARQRYAVVLAESVPVFAERGEKKPVLFRLHEGAVAVIREEQKGWYHIMLPDESTGWIRSRNGQVGT